MAGKKDKDPKDTFMGINPKAAVPKWVEGGGLQRTFNPTPSTPFQRDVANVENTVMGGIRKGATAVEGALIGASDALGTGISTGMRAVGDYFGGSIKPEPPTPTPSPAPPVATPKVFPSSKAPLTPAPKGLAKPTEPTLDLSQFGAGGSQSPVRPPDSPYYDRVNPTANGGYSLVPKGVAAPEQDIDSELNKMVDDLMGKAKFTDPHGRIGYNPQLMGMAKDIKAAQIQGKYGLAGRQMSEEATASQGAENRKVDRERIAADREKAKFEVDKFAQQNDMKNPDNYVKMLALLSPQTKSLDEDGNETTSKDFMQGVKLLSELGYQAPSGFNVPKAKLTAPKPGTVVRGYKFKGGNPADANSWEKI